MSSDESHDDSTSADPPTDVAPVDDDGLVVDMEGEEASLVPDPLSAVTVDRDEWRDRAQRIAAEFDNFRKRSASQRTDDVDRATGRLAEAMLPVLDAAEAAFVQHPAEIEPLFNLLLGELRKHGLESMNLLEQPFDPSVADAVAHETSEEGDVVVAEVLRSGYLWKGRTLRPAMVRTRG